MPPLRAPLLPYRSPPPEGWFICKVTDTATYEGVNAYEFDEWQLVGNATYAKKDGGRVATSLNPGVALFGVFEVDDYALARSASGAGGLIWEMLPLPASNTFVTNVCPIIVGGVVTGIQVEYTDTSGNTTCVTNPTDCCLPCQGACPEGIPTHLCLTLSGGTGGCSVYDGVTIDLVWMGAANGWMSGAPYNLVLMCDASGSFTLYNGFGASCPFFITAGFGADKVVTCVPFVMEVDVTLDTRCCSGTITATFTEGPCSGGSGSGGGGGCSISATDHGSGTATAADVVSVTLAGETVAAGSTLLVAVAVTDIGGSWSVTFDGATMAPEYFGALGSGSVVGMWRVYKLYVASATTGDIVASYTYIGAGNITMNVSAVDGYCTDGVIDQEKHAAGSASAPNSGATGTTSTADEFVFAMAVLSDPGGSAVTDGTWGGGFTDLHSVGPSAFRLRTGYQIASATGTFTANLTGTTPPGWDVSVVTVE